MLHLTLYYSRNVYRRNYNVAQIKCKFHRTTLRDVSAANIKNNDKRNKIKIKST